MQAAAKEHNWSLNFGEIALMWRGGCIIRSVFLDKIKSAYERDPALVNLLLDPFFKDAIEHAQAGWRRVVGEAARLGIPMPAISAALAYYDGYRTEKVASLTSPAGLFWRNTYERMDQPEGTFFHTNWTGEGGDTASTQYGV